MSLAASALLLPLSGEAGRPWNTDDAGVIDAGACQLEAWTERSRADGTTTPVYWANAGCTPMENTELSLGMGREHGDDDHATLTAWQVKHALRDITDEQAGFAVAFSSDRDRRLHHAALGDVQLTGLTSIPLQGEVLVAHLNAGVARQREEAAWKTRAAWGGALEWKVLPATHVGVEMFGQGGTRSGWQVGARHELIAERVQLDVSFGSPVGRTHEERTLTVGVVLVSPVFLH